MRLANFPGSRLGAFRTMRGCRNYGTLNCAICGRTAKKKCATQLCCGRKACKQEMDRQRWHRKTREYRNRSDHPGELGETRAPLPPPVCACGVPLRFGSDSLTGASLEYCPRCQVERPLQTHGERRLDQREILEAEILAAIDRASAPVSHEVSEYEGTREFLGKKAVA